MADDKTIQELTRIVEYLKANQVEGEYTLDEAHKDLNFIAREQSRIANMLKNIKQANDRIMETIDTLKELTKNDEAV